jgi:hypothetical protein
MKNEPGATTILDIETTNDYLDDVKKIVIASRKAAYRAVNVLLLQRNWLIGKRIYEEELKGDNRAEYGARIIKSLSKVLTKEFGTGFSQPYLYQFYTFYKFYPNIFRTYGKSCPLSWSHFRFLISVFDIKARVWYENECVS